MIQIKELLSILLCISLIFSSAFVLKYTANINAFAEENGEETNAIEFETLEKQILNSERWCSSTDDRISVSLDIDNKWFLPNEDIVVSYTTSNEEEIISFDYSASGFEVVDIGIDEENRSRITTELNCLPNQEEYLLNIPITVGEEETSVSLYAINNEYGTFVSEFSKANAYERYLDYAVTENIITLDQAEEMWYAYLEIDEENTLNDDEIITENIDSGIETASVGQGAVCGYLQWKEREDGDIHPLRSIKVEIYYKLLGVGIKLATTYTNDEGYYYAEIDAHDNVYIKIYAGDGNVMVGSGIFGWPYSIKFDAKKYQNNVSNGETVAIITPVISMKSNEEPKIKEETKHAFQIAQAAIAARDYADAMMNQDVAPVTIIYPSLSIIGTCYIPVLSCIAIDGCLDKYNDYQPFETWDVIMHEYGHHIELLLNIKLYPPYDHYSSVNHAEDRGTDIGTRLAWGEAWPTVFGLIAQSYMIQNSNLDSNILTVGDTKYTDYGNWGYDLESNASIYSDCYDYVTHKTKQLGESCEQSIMSVLWDLFDGIATEYLYDPLSITLLVSHNDNISLSYTEWWNLTTESGTYRFSDRANRFYELYANQPEKIKAFAEILTYYKMSPSCPTVSNEGSVSIIAPPSLSWSAEGGSTTYPNNSFDIIVYDTSYNEIMRVENIDVTYYEFDPNEWKQALKNHGFLCNQEYEVYITIAGSRVEPLLLNPDFSTGPYYSEYKLISVTTGHAFAYEQYNSTSHKLICVGCDGEETILSHNFEYVDLTSNQHTKLCTDCGYSVTSSHNFVYRSTDEYHILTCSQCGMTSGGQQSHSWTTVNDGNLLIGKSVKCEICGHRKILGFDDEIIIIKGKKPEFDEETE